VKRKKKAGGGRAKKTEGRGREPEEDGGRKKSPWTKQGSLMAKGSQRKKTLSPKGEGKGKDRMN